MLLGQTQTVVSNLIASPTSPTSLDLNLTTGFIMQLVPVDTTAYGSLPANTQTVMQLGISTATGVTLSTAGLSAGQSMYALIQATFTQIDAIRPGDPNGGVLPYINVNNPTQPFNGPNNSGTPQNTVRQGVCTISVTYGNPATTGDETPPSPSANNVGLFLVDLTYGQTVITSGEILNPNNVEGAEQTPVLAGLLNAHHQGFLGQAPQIQLSLDGDSPQEVQGELPVINMVASNTRGAVSAFISGSGDPNGTQAGNNDVNGASDMYWDNVGMTLWVCDTTGDSSGAHWTEAGATAPTGHPFQSINLQVFASSGSYTPTTNTRYIRATVVGGGGGGGGGAYSILSGSSNSGGGGGGGGGGVVPIETAIGNITSPVTVTIGTGGTGGAGAPNNSSTGTNGGSGGNTSFGTYAVAYGGGGGVQATAYGQGGAGGLGTFTGSGIQGIVAGGNAGGISGNDNAGSGGGNAYGGGGIGGTGLSHNGTAGNAYGGGGGGGYYTGGAGANGANGLVLIEEFIGA
jgi:hypothetical protein